VLDDKLVDKRIKTL